MLLAQTLESPLEAAALAFGRVVGGLGKPLLEHRPGSLDGVIRRVVSGSPASGLEGRQDDVEAMRELAVETEGSSRGVGCHLGQMRVLRA